MKKSTIRPVNTILINVPILGSFLSNRKAIKIKINWISIIHVPTVKQYLDSKIYSDVKGATPKTLDFIIKYEPNATRVNPINNFMYLKTTHSPPLKQ